MLVISWLPRLASPTERAISLVVAACSSTAAAIVSWKWAIWSMIVRIPVIESTLLVVSFWIASILAARSAVASGATVGCHPAGGSPITAASLPGCCA